MGFVQKKESNLSHHGGNVPLNFGESKEQEKARRNERPSIEHRNRFI